LKCSSRKERRKKEEKNLFAPADSEMKGGGRHFDEARAISGGKREWRASSATGRRKDDSYPLGKSFRRTGKKREEGKNCSTYLHKKRGLRNRQEALEPLLERGPKRGGASPRKWGGDLLTRGGKMAPSRGFKRKGRDAFFWEKRKEKA